MLNVVPYIVVAFGIMITPVMILTVSLLSVRGKVSPSTLFSAQYSGADRDTIQRYWVAYHRANVVPAALFLIASLVVSTAGVVYAAMGGTFERVIIIMAFPYVFTVIAYGAWASRYDRRLVDEYNNAE